MKEKQSNLLVLVLIGLALGYAWLYRHVEDDAFITFRYSKHLVEGLGPVWNADQRVEGYTNFLWMLMIAVPIGLGMDPVLPAVFVSLFFLGLNLWLLYRIALVECRSHTQAIWVWLPLVASHTLLLFATSGLETAMNGFLWTLALWQLQGILRQDHQAQTRSVLLLGLTVAFAILSRLEGGLLAVACIAAFAWRGWRTHRPIMGGVLRFTLPLALLVGPWLAWKLVFYGDLLPNSFHVKAGNGSLLAGLKYVGLFLASSGVWIPFLLRLGVKKAEPNDHQTFTRIALLLAASFLAYIIIAGGDYLEFRLLTPVIPIILIWPMLWLARSASQTPWRTRLAAVLMLLAAIAWGQGHGRWFNIGQLDPALHVVDADAKFMSFAAQGQALGVLLEHDPSIRLAIGACGAIPYYSEFYGIDLYGLNEPSSEFESYATGYGPGHARLGNLNFIERKNPHLISLRCEFAPPERPMHNYSLQDPQIAEIVHGFEHTPRAKGLQVLELPLGNGFMEVCIYWSPHPRVDALIKNKALKIYALKENQ